MATSLAQQLERLKAPQTSNLYDSQKRASLLFDTKDAATKDRETIFDIGNSGLDELIGINSIFTKYKATLFEQTSRDFQRAVESAEVNENLNKQIKTFLLQLSPYFLLQATHKCLEWMIRRYEIHAYNQDELMMLILPYHETKIFVRCVQLMHLKSSKNKWNWLKCLQKPGVPLTKKLIFQHSEKNPEFLDFIGRIVQEAIKVHGIKAHNLQTLFGFYCITIVGTIHTIPDITDHHISSILPCLLKGLSSDVVDFLAASYMITGQLITKVTLNEKLLNKLLRKISACPNTALIKESVMLLTLICMHQKDNMKAFPEDATSKILMNNRFAGILGEIANEKVNIVSLYVKLMAIILRKVQLKETGWVVCKKLLESLLIEICLSDRDAEAVIQCALSSYALRAKKNPRAPIKNGHDDVIMIDSEDEDAVPLNDGNMEVVRWYSEYLHKLQRQYSDPFDRVIKSIMKSEKQIISESKKRSLKAVLGFLLQFSCNDDQTNIFENLYHHSANQRLMAVKYLTDNFNELKLSTETREIFSDSISERLTDDNPNVVLQILENTDNNFVELIGKDKIYDKVFVLLDRYYENKRKWAKCTLAAIRLLTSEKVLDDNNCDAIFVRLFSFLFPTWEGENMMMKAVVKSELGKRFKWLRDIEIESVFSVLCEKNLELPGIEVILENAEKSLNLKIGDAGHYFNCMLLALTLPKKSSPEVSNRVFDLIMKYEFSLDVEQMEFVPEIKNIYTYSLNSILNNTNFSTLPEKIGFSKQNSAIVLIFKTFKFLVNQIFEAESSNEYSIVMSHFLNALFNETNDRFRFLANFFSVHIIQDVPFEFSPDLQLRTLKLTCSILKNSTSIKNIEIESIASILIGLRCQHTTVREATLEFLEVLQGLEVESALIDQILRQRDEISIDEEQIALVLFNFFETKDAKQKREHQEMLNGFIGLCISPDTAMYLSVGMLEVMKHISTNKILEKTVELGARIYQSSTTDPGMKTLFTFSKYESEILRLTILRFNEKVARNISTMNEVFGFILKTFAYHNCIINVEGRFTSPAAFLLDTLDSGFFNHLSQNLKRDLLDAILIMVASSESNDVATSANKFMKQLQLKAQDIEAFLEAMRQCESTPKALKKPITRRQSRAAVTASQVEATTTSPEFHSTISWKKGVKLLEFLQNKKHIANVEKLIPIFFKILKKCLDFEQQSPVEYVKQMSLSCVLHCCIELSPDGSSKRSIIPDNIFQIDLVVQCIRATQNPQTHHHALLLLCHLASMVPDQVLHNIMDIFTFMGSSVVRLDDAYSAQIISKIIAKVIPILVQADSDLSSTDKENLTVPVLKIFADIILDVPEHRRIPLYTKLIKTLGAKNYLWMFYGVLFENQVVKSGNATGKAGDRRRFEIALELANEFDPEVLIETCTKFLEYLRQLPIDRSETSTASMDVDITDEVIFVVEARTSKELRHFRYAILQFMGDLTSSPQLVNQIAKLSPDSGMDLKTYYQNCIIKILMYVPEVSKTIEKLSKTPQTTYWKVILNHCYDILDNVISLLAPDVFLIVVHGLMKHKIIAVRKRIIELLTSKIQHQTDFAEKYRHEDLMNILMQLRVIITEISVGDSHDMQVLHQTCFIAIKLLSRILASEYPEEFIEILDSLIELIQQREQFKLANSVLATAVICLGEICVNLRAHALSRLSQFMPLLFAISKNLSSTDLLTSFIASIQKIVESIPLFISPYIVKIITILSQLKKNLPNQEDKLAQRIDGIFMKLSSTVPGRVLIPAINKSHQTIIKRKQFSSIPSVMKIILNAFDHIPGDELTILQSDLSSFFISALQFRSDHSGTTMDVDDIETAIISSFVHLILKLSESTFKPLYQNVYDWAIQDVTGDYPERAITFYALSHQIGDSLKSIFTFYASVFLENAGELLDKCNTSKTEELYFEDADQNTILITNIIKTLQSTFLYNSQNFINASRFTIISQPLVDQIENEIIATSKESKALLSLCIAQLVATTNDDSLWKQLNYQVLMKARTNNPNTRIFAVKTCVEIARKLGEDFLPFLPETIPFLAELLEDENPKVEKSCQKSIQELERIVGEPLQKYF